MEINYTIERLKNHKQLLIKDAGSDFGTVSNISNIQILIYGEDKATPELTVDFTDREITAFVESRSVYLSFGDERLWSNRYAPDNFYTCIIRVHYVDGTTVDSATEAFASYFYLQQTIFKSINDLNVPIKSYFEANPRIVGILTALWQLDYLSAIISYQREAKWRKVYSFLEWNFGIAVSGQTEVEDDVETSTEASD